MLAAALVLMSIPFSIETVRAQKQETSDVEAEVQQQNLGVKVNFFDYNFKEWTGQNGETIKASKDWIINDTMRAMNPGVEDKNLFLFGGKRTASEYGRHNAWTQQNGGVYQGIVTDELKDGTVQFNKESGISGVDLFPSSESKALDGIKPYYNVDFEFIPSGNGTYYFDSMKHAVSKANSSEGELDLDFDFTQAGPVFSTTTGTKNRNYGFFPFNTCDVNNKANQERHHLFGMELGFDFYMPKNGKIDSQNDMIFHFNGDDDVWVYIDGKLALDLGGIHDASDGTINFATGVITYGNIEGKGSYATEEGYLYKKLGIDKTNYKTHTLKMYYLERGEFDSNCMIEFNLPVLPDGKEISVKKEVKNLNEQMLAGEEYKFQLLYGKSKTNLDAYKGFYDVYVGENLKVTKVATDGIISIKANETAKIPEKAIPADCYYQFEEIDSGKYAYNTHWYTVENISTVANNTDTTGRKTDIWYQGDEENGKYVVFVNDCTEATAELVLLKEMKAGETTEDSFKFNLELDGQNYVNNPITLKAGESATISKLPVGVSYKITEVLEDKSYRESYKIPTVIVEEPSVATPSAISGATISGVMSVTNAAIKVQYRNQKQVIATPTPKQTATPPVITTPPAVTMVPTNTPAVTSTPSINKTLIPVVTPIVTPTQEPVITTVPVPEETEKPSSTPEASLVPLETPEIPDVSPSSSPEAEATKEPSVIEETKKPLAPVEETPAPVIETAVPTTDIPATQAPTQTPIVTDIPEEEIPVTIPSMKPTAKPTTAPETEQDIEEEDLPNEPIEIAEKEEEERTIVVDDVPSSLPKTGALGKLAKENPGLFYVSFVLVLLISGTAMGICMKVIKKKDK